MKIGILGAGRVGGNLGRIWAAAGHEITYGVLDPADPRLGDLLDPPTGRARAALVPVAAAFGEVVVLATPWSATRQVIESPG